MSSETTEHSTRIRCWTTLLDPESARFSRVYYYKDLQDELHSRAKELVDSHFSGEETIVTKEVFKQ